MKSSFRKCLRLGAEPRKNSPNYETELAVKAAQEDICACVCTMTAILLWWSNCHVVAAIIVTLIAVAQALEAFKWSVKVRAERGRNLLREGGAE